MRIHNRSWNLDRPRPVKVQIAESVCEVDEGTFRYSAVIKCDVVMGSQCTSYIHFLRDHEEVKLLRFYLLIHIDDL